MAKKAGPGGPAFVIVADMAGNHDNAVALICAAEGTREAGLSFFRFCLWEADLAVAPEGQISLAFNIASRIESFQPLGDIVPGNLFARLAKRVFGLCEDHGRLLPSVHHHLHDGAVDVAVRRQRASAYLHLAIEASAAEMPFSEKT